MTASVAVIGGGLAGITTALGCADAGQRVTLLESKPRLGGLTASFSRDGIWVDTGQHVFLRCFTAYRALLERLGVSDLVELQPRFEVRVRSGVRPGEAVLRRTAWPAPLHLALALARYRWLGPADRLRAVRGALALRRLDRTDPALDEQSFGAWLASRGQSRRAVDRLWDLIGIAALNAPAEEASLALAATVFQLGLLDRADAADIGWSRVPLQHLHGRAADRALAAAGVETRCRARVVSLEPGADGWTVVTEERERFDQVVVATSPRAAERLLPEGAIGLAPGWSERLGAVAILNLHVIWDRPVLDEPFIAAVDSPLPWIFERTEASGLREGYYTAVSVSAADDLRERTVAQLREWALPRLRAVLPRARRAKVRQFFVTREPEATFSQLPGSRRWRPGTETRLPGLHLAGAWTDTGWPATMEGAVRSGEAATRRVLGLPAMAGTDAGAHPTEAVA